MNKRKRTRKIRIGKNFIGGGYPVLVQSMTNTDTHDVAATIRQIKKLEDAGCEVVRVSVPDTAAAAKIGKIKRAINIPLVADIHFDYKIALLSIKEGVDKLRINPGNIGSPEKVAAVVDAAKKAGIPIRIGVNSGSLKAMHDLSGGKNLLRSRAEKLVDAALSNIKVLEENNFFDTVVSLKASDVATTIEAYRLFTKKRNYPLHIGITEAGSIFRGTIKSSVGLGVLLYDGIGDTLRVSLTANPVEEVKVAYNILQSLELRSTGIEIISCPTCSRCEVDLIKIVNELERKIVRISSETSVFQDKPLKIAVMGCVVNGPGEAIDSDIGIAGGKNNGLLFVGGKVVGKIKPEKWTSTLMKLILEKCGEKAACSKKEK